MSLFPTHVGTRSSTQIAPMLDTPFGVVEFGVHLGDVRVDPDAATSFRSGEVARLVWQHGGATAELLLAPYPLPEAGSADRAGVDCWAAVLRVYAERPLASVLFSCLWRAGATWTVAEGGASGEGLEAQRWSDGEQVVTIGTADAEALYQEAHGAGLLPAQWRERLRAEAEEARDLVQQSRAGFRLRLPGLEPGERAQVHYLLAWGPDQLEEVLTWLAVGDTPA